MNNKKGSNFIIIIFVVLILLPSFILVPITNFILNNGGSSFLELPIFAKISAFIASFSTMLGIFMIYRQIEKDKRVNSSRFLVDLNDSMMSFESTRNVYKKLLDLEGKKYDRKLYEKAFKSDEDKYDLLEYLSFFENIEFFIKNGILKISEVNDLFAKRFFIASNNLYSQEIELIKNDFMWSNVYRLHRSIIEFRKDNGYEIPYNKTSLSKVKNYKKYSNNYYNYKDIKNNLFIIFILSSSIFTILFFFILLAFNYPVNNISSIIGSCGTIIGAFAIFFQLNAENSINKARFLFDLNKSFISKNIFKKVATVASVNFYKDLPFTEKNNHIKKINDEDIFHYFTFFESINVMIENKALKTSEMNDMFGFRFFAAANNLFIQNKFLLPNALYFRNIYSLFDKLSKYRLKIGQNIIYNKTRLDLVDKNYEKYLI